MFFTVAFALDTFSNSGIRSTDPAKDAKKYQGHFWQCGSDIQNVSFENRFQYITDLIGGGYDAYLMVFKLKLKVSFRLAL
jgi:hypothetical protein